MIATKIPLPYSRGSLKFSTFDDDANNFFFFNTKRIHFKCYFQVWNMFQFIKDWAKHYAFFFYLCFITNFHKSACATTFKLMRGSLNTILSNNTVNYTMVDFDSDSSLPLTSIPASSITGVSCIDFLLDSFWLFILI